MKFKIVSAMLFACIVSTQANATLVEHYGYELDTDTNIVTGGGLEWLQWDETVNTTISSALTTYSGWRLATNVEMAALFNAWDFGYIYGSDATQEYGGDVVSTLGRSPIDRFFEVFGLTDGDPHRGNNTRAIYGTPAGGHNTSYVYAAYDPGGAFQIDPALAVLYPEHDFYSRDWLSRTAGVALVRERTTVASPSTIVLFMFAPALLGFFGHRRKKQA